MIIDAICAILVLFLYYKWFKKPLNETYFLIMFIYQGFWIICSLIFLENTSIYMVETDRSAYRVYGVPIYILFHISSILVFNFSYSNFNKKYSFSMPFISITQQLSLFRKLFWILFCCLCINLFLSPIPFFVVGESVNIYSRFDFWANARFPFLSIFGETTAVLIVIASFIFLHNKKEGVFLLFLYLLYLLLLGHKFGSIFSLLFVFFLPYMLLSRQLYLKINFKVLVLALVFSIIAVYITVLSYTNFNPYNNVSEAQTPFLAVLYRAFALQSQLIWISIEQNVYLGKAPTLFITDIVYGMHHLMNKYTASSIDIGNHTGSQLTNGYPSILIEVFPIIIALIINLFFYIIFSYIVFLLFLFLKKSNYFFYLVGYYCMSFMLNFLSMGNFSITIPVLILLFFSFFFIKKRKIYEN